MAKKPKFTRVVTPEGIAKFPWITKADTQFNAEGEYKVDLLLDPDDEDTKGLVKAIDDAIEAHVAELKKAKKMKKNTKVNYPYKEDTDEDDNETGLIAFTFKQKKVIKPKNGEPFSVTIPIVDSKGKKIQSPPPIYGGSRIAVSADLVPYPFGENAKVGSIGAGVTMRLVAVQLIEPAEYEKDYGFGTHDDGYVADDAPAAESDDPGPGDEDAPPDF